MSTTVSTSTLLDSIRRVLGWLSVLMFFFTANVFAGQVNLAWNASSGPVSGYKVYYGTASGNYASNVNVGNTTTATVASLADGSTYYFAVKAYDSTGNESGFSNEVSKPLTVAAPSASFSADKTSGTAPVTVNLADTSTGTITSRIWDLGDGTTSTAQSVAKTYSATGSYTVKLTVTNAGGSTTATKTISVTAPTAAAPVASFSATPTTGTAPLLVTLTDTSTGTVSTRTWDLGDGTTSTTQSVAKTYSSAGTYTVKLTVSNASGSSTTTKTISTTATAPVANFTASPTSGVAPLPVTFSNSSTGTVVSYNWNFGDNTTSIAQNPSKTYANPGTYTVTLTATGASGTTPSTKTQTINVTAASASTGGPVAAYNFDEASGTAVVDASGQGNHGTINGATRTTGKFGKALSFDGSSNWVSIPAANSLDLTTAMTLEAWVYPKNLADRQPILAKQGTTMGSPNRGYMLSAGDSGGSGKVEVEVYKSETGQSALLSSAALNTAGWQHVAFVYQYLADGNSTMTVYINGVASGSNNTAIGPVQKNAQPLDLGRYYWNSGYARYFNGLIDEVRIYNRALSVSEIQTDMNTPVGADSTKVQYTFATQPSGLSLSYGGVSRVTPFTVDAVAGSQQTISAPATQQSHNFSSWSDGGAATHTITIGTSPKTYTATYVAVVAAPTANFTANSTNGTAPLAVSFTSTSTGDITAYSWDFGDGTTSTAQNPAKTYSNAGTYTVKLTVTGSGGSNTATKTNYITASAPAPTASFNATPTTGAAPLLVTLACSSTGTITGRLWDFGDGTTSTAQSAVKTYNTAGTYTVKLTVSNASGSTTTSKTITATATAPVAGFTATPTSGTAPLATSFTSTSTGTITGYAWDFGDGGTSTAASPTHTYAKAGTYTVKLTATGPAGTNTKTQTGYIVVSAAPSGGLVAAYNFEEAGSTMVLDVSGNGNHGTLSGATRTTGKFGQALSFDGVNDWVSIPDADSLDLTTAMTLEAWVYPKNLADRRPILAKQGTTMGSPNRGYMLSAGDSDGSGKIEVEVYKSETGKSALLSSAALNTAGWQHVAFVYQYVGSGTSKMTLYINGVAKGSSTTAVGPVQKNAQPLDLGRYYWNSGYARYFNGLIDEVRIYNRALNASEIVADMNKAVVF